MRHFAFMCLLHEVHETGEVALDVNIRVFQRVSYACLRREVNDWAKFFMIEHGLQAAPIGDISFDESEVFRCLENLQPGSFQAFIVKGAEIIETENTAAKFKESAAKMKANKPCAAGYKYGIYRPDVFGFHYFYHHRELPALASMIVHRIEGADTAYVCFIR